MILYIYGEDSFRSRSYLKQSVEQFKKQRDPQGYNVVFLDGKKEPFSKLVAEMKAAPFLAEKRMVIVENILSSSDKELLEQIHGVAQNKQLPESNIVIFWQGEGLSKVKEAKALHELLAKEKYAQEFAALVGAKLQDWIRKEFEKRNATVEKEVVNYLSMHAADMWQLHSLIEQLTAFRHGDSIALEHVQLFMEEKIDDNVFNAIEALVYGDKKKAFTLIYEQRRLGEDEGKLFGLFIWQFRILFEMAEALDRDPSLTSDALAKLLSIHPFVAKKNLGAAKRFSLQKLQTVYRELLAIDLKTKTGQADQSLLLDTFVAAV